MGLFNKKNEKLEDSFSAIQTNADGLPLVAMINLNAKKYSGKKNYPWFFGISIKLNNPEANGLPNKAELERLNIFQDKILKIFAETVDYCFLGWSNWNGHRELLFYTTEPKELVDKLNKLNAEEPEFSFAFRSHYDVQWKTLINAFNL